MLIKPNIIISCAKTWVGTRFQHQGRIKKTSNHKGGCDCIGLILGVGKELDIQTRQLHPITTLDRHNYRRQPNDFILQESLDSAFYARPWQQCRSGDILLFCLTDTPQHVAFLSEDNKGNKNLIHSYLQARKVVEHHFDSYWQERAIAGYRLGSAISDDENGPHQMKK